MNTLVLIVTLVFSDGSFGFQLLPAPVGAKIEEPKVEFYHYTMSPKKVFDVNTNCVIMKVPIKETPEDKQTRRF
jgi:hypothetical protein